MSDRTADYGVPDEASRGKGEPQRGPAGPVPVKPPTLAVRAKLLSDQLGEFLALLRPAGQWNLQAALEYRGFTGLESFTESDYGAQVSKLQKQYEASQRWTETRLAEDPRSSDTLDKFAEILNEWRIPAFLAQRRETQRSVAEKARREAQSNQDKQRNQGLQKAAEDRLQHARRILDRARQKNPGKNTFTVAGDGDRFFPAVNGSPGKEHPDVTGLRSHLGSLEPWLTSNCAEPAAVSLARHANVALSDMLVLTVDADGNYKPPCEHCQGWLEKRADDFYRIKPNTRTSQW